MADKYIIDSDELASLRKDASVSTAISELANILSGRSQDLPHRFRAPDLFGKYLDDYGVNQTYLHHIQIGYGPSPIVLQVTNRPSQGILELIFEAADGSRLFILEIEYKKKEESQ